MCLITQNVNKNDYQQHAVVVNISNTNDINIKYSIGDGYWDGGVTWYTASLDTGSTSNKNIAVNFLLGHNGSSGSTTGTIYLQGSNDNSSWSNITSKPYSIGAGSASTVLFNVTSTYRYYRVAHITGDNEMQRKYILAYQLI